MLFSNNTKYSIIYRQDGVKRGVDKIMRRNFLKLFLPSHQKLWCVGLLAVAVGAFFAIPAEAKKTINDATGNASVLEQVMPAIGYADTALPKTFPEMVGFWVKIALSVVGIAFFILMVYAGIVWMLAQGQEEKIKTAQNTIIMAVIGLMVVVSGYAVSNFVVDRVVLPQSFNTGVDTPEIDANAPLGCCVDWVGTGDQWGKEWFGEFLTTPACRVTTKADCKFQGEAITGYDKHGGPEGEGNWLFYYDEGFYKDAGQINQEKCVEQYC